jgi:hypothetical protein
MVSNTVLSAVASLIKYLEGHISKTEVVNNLESIATPDALEVIPHIEALHATIKSHKDVDLGELTGLIKELVSEAKLIPKDHMKMPEMKMADYTAQFKALQEAVVAVGKFVKDQKTVVEAPVVNVDAPNVNVAPPDLKPLQSDIKAVVEAIKKIIIPKNDNSAVEVLVSKSNDLLKKILEKPVGSGGGGGIASYVDSAGIVTQVKLSTQGSVPTDTKQGFIIQFASVSVNQAGDNAVVVAVANKRIKVLSAALVSGGTVGLKWRSATTDISGTMPLIANSGFVLPASSPGQGCYLQTAAGEALNINLSGGVQVSGHLTYYEE